jgi:hypothetical protein
MISKQYRESLISRYSCYSLYIKIAGVNSPYKILLKSYLVSIVLLRALLRLEDYKMIRLYLKQIFYNSFLTSNEKLLLEQRRRELN